MKEISQSWTVSATVTTESTINIETTDKEKKELGLGSNGNVNDIEVKWEQQRVASLSPKRMERTDKQNNNATCTHKCVPLPSLTIRTRYPEKDWRLLLFWWRRWRSTTKGSNGWRQNNTTWGGRTATKADTASWMLPQLWRLKPIPRKFKIKPFA